MNFTPSSLGQKPDSANTLLKKKLNFVQSLSNDPFFKRENHGFDLSMEDAGIENFNIENSNISAFQKQSTSLPISRKTTAKSQFFVQQPPSKRFTLNERTQLWGNCQHESSDEEMTYEGSGDLKRDISHQTYSTNVDDESMSFSSSKASSPFPVTNVETNKSIFAFLPQKPFVNNDSFQIFKKAPVQPKSQARPYEDDDFFKRQPLQELVNKHGRGEFIYDPENGGGRRRRIKKLSRIEMIEREALGELCEDCSSDSDGEQDQAVEVQLENIARPLNIDESYYKPTSDASQLSKLEDCRNPDLNSISHQTMAELVRTKQKPYVVIDCRFDYEFQGGHIEGALNLDSPLKIEEYFFKSKSQVEQFMKNQTIIIFHCEFSQHRGPKMYRTLREIDRNLHMHHYPQLFYPEIYLLEGGYKEFHSNNPSLCQGSYLPMANKEYKEDCKIKFSRTRKLFKQYSTKEAVHRLLEDE